MSVKEQVIHELATLTDAELVEVAEFLAFLRFRDRLQSAPDLDEAKLAAQYAAFGEADQALAEEGIAEYERGLRQEDA
ncbi:MAG: hypothetical protein NTW86_16710 [Candidatus Sumerlaeota bacterium]|nr:hypothetical protein [Candidatus Sumerlaeota bacterium]